MVQCFLHLIPCSYRENTGTRHFRPYFFRPDAGCNSIQYKDTSVNNQLRLALNNIRGDNYLLSRDGTVKTNYRLSVEKNDEQKARLLLNNV